MKYKLILKTDDGETVEFDPEVLFPPRRVTFNTLAMALKGADRGNRAHRRAAMSPKKGTPNREDWRANRRSK